MSDGISINPHVKINAKKQDPNKFVVVRNRETGKKVSLSSMKFFDKRLYEKIEEVPEVAPIKAGDGLEVPAEEPIVEVPEGVIDTPVGATSDSEARYLELKEKGWTSLNGEERAEYKELKELYGA